MSGSPAATPSHSCRASCGQSSSRGSGRRRYPVDDGERTPGALRASGRPLLAWAPVVGWAALIFALSATPNLRFVPDAGLDFVIRKLGHLGVFGILALLSWRAMAGSTAWRRPWAWAFALNPRWSSSLAAYRTVPARPPGSSRPGEGSPNSDPSHPEQRRRRGRVLMETAFAVAPEIGLAPACRSLRVSRATAYCDRSTKPPGGPWTRRCGRDLCDVLRRVDVPRVRADDVPPPRRRGGGPRMRRSRRTAFSQRRPRSSPSSPTRG